MGSKGAVPSTSWTLEKTGIFGPFGAPESRLANRAVEDDQVLAEARGLAQALVAQSPQALGATKRAMRQAGNLSLDETLTLEGELQDACKATEDFHTRVAAFRQRRRK